MSVRASVNEMGLPVLARLTADREGYEDAVYGIMRIASLICMPAFIGLALLADPLVPWLFGAHWQSSVAPLQLMAGFGIFQAWTSVIAQLLVAHGAAGQAMRLNLFVSLSLLAFAGIGASFGLLPAVAGIGLAYVVALPLAVRALHGRLHLRAGRMLRGQAPVFAATALMAATVLMAGRLPGIAGHPMLVVGTSLIAGAAVYVVAIAAMAPDLARRVAVDLRRPA